MLLLQWWDGDLHIADSFFVLAFGGFRFALSITRRLRGMAQQTFARAMRIWIGMKTHSTAATDNSQSGILGAQHSLDLRKFSGSFFLPLCLFRVSFL